MADTFWNGRAIYNSNTERDTYAKMIEDFISARLNVVPEADPNHTVDPSGVEYRNNMAIGDDSGPGFIWSIKLVQGDLAIAEGQALEATVTDPALNSTAGWVSAG